VRDLARESWHAVSGQEVNKLLAALSVAGLGITAWTYSSMGAVAPVREGVTVVKAAARGGRLSEGFVKSAGRMLASGRAERVGVALADLGAMQGKAGTRAALTGLRETQSVSEISKIARLATARGRGTLAVLKTLGRDSFVLSAAAVVAFGWLLGAFVNLFLIVAAIQQGFIALVRKLWPSRGLRPTQLDAIA
jgi:hypothetical protein